MARSLKRDHSNQHAYVVTASFDDPAQARDAMVQLENHGFDAQYVSLVDRPDSITRPGATADAERHAGATVLTNYVQGAAIGALAGAAIAVIVVLLSAGASTGGILVGLVGGGTAGFFLGGYWGAGARLPVNEDAWQTYEIDARDDAPIRLEVGAADADGAHDAAAVLRASGATAVQT
jgi:hypothetical protein